MTGGQAGESQLVESIRGGRAIVVAGTGVSVAASFDPGTGCSHPNSSWAGLLEDGLAWLRQHALIEEQVADAHLVLIRKTPQTHNFISAAEQVTRGMGGATSPHFAEWLKRTVGTITARDRSLLDALAEIRGLGNMLATTNYDGLLLEGDSGLAPVTWCEADELVGAVRRRDSSKVIFLHGYWRKPKTVILDWTSYEQIARDDQYREDLAAFWKTNIWVYVGCGVNGLGDPDFGLLLERYGSRARQAGHWDYCLVCNHQKQEFQAHFDAKGFNIRAVPIGPSHADLPNFLRSLLPPPKPPAVAPADGPAAARGARLRGAYLKEALRDVENRLAASIHNARFIDLGIADDPSLIQLSWGYQNPENLRSYSSVWNAFEGCERRMLLLGAPGAGKTTALLQLAKLLAQRAAESDSNAPVPFVLNLSKFRLEGGERSRWWPDRGGKAARPPDGGNEAVIDLRIEDWVVAELAAFPGLGREVARRWLHEGRVALLLDGLDEFNDDRRGELVRLLNNSLLRGHPDLAIVVCSRTNEYLALGGAKEAWLQLRGAIQLQPLSEQQIADHLHAARASGLLKALPNDAALRELAKTPLTLSMLVLAYGGVAPDALPAAASLSETRHRLFELYVSRMLQRRERRKRGIPFDDARANDVPVTDYTYGPDLVRRWLGWLGLALSVRMRTSFAVNGFHSVLNRGVVEARQPFDFAAVFASLGVLLAIALGVVALAILPPTCEAIGDAAAVIVLLASLLPVVAASKRGWSLGIGASAVAFIVVIVLDCVLVGQLVAGGPGGVSPIPVSVLAVFGVLAVGFLAQGFGYVDREEWSVVLGFVLAVALVATLQADLVTAHFPLFESGWWQASAATLVFAVAFAVGAPSLWLRRSALALVLGALLMAGAGGWSTGVGALHVLASLGGTALLVLALGEAHAATCITVGGSLFALIGGLSAGAPGSFWGATLFSACALAAKFYQRWRPGKLEVLLPHPRSLGCVRTALQRIALKLNSAQGVIAGSIDRMILSPSTWRIAALGRRFAWRRDDFLEICRQSFLLKRSGSEWEFTHRLLRDYFALLQLRPGLTATDPLNRLPAIRALGFQGEAALDMLGELSEDADPAVRASALEGLSHIASPQVAERFRRLAFDRHPGVRRALVASLGRLPGSVSTELIRNWDLLGDGCEVETLFESVRYLSIGSSAYSQLVERLGRKAVEPLRSLLRSKNVAERKRAVWIFAHFIDIRDRMLLLDGDMLYWNWIDPARPISLSRMDLLAARLSWSREAVRARYVLLADDFMLNIAV